MTTSTTITHRPIRFRTDFWSLSARLSLVLFVGLFACNHAGQSGMGAKRRLKVSVGEIKEITVPGRGDGRSELIGTSDNQEVVEVSRQQLAPAVDTLNKNNGSPAIFQIKGITVGMANVIFSEKPMGTFGSGQPVRTYVVQVTAN